MKRICVIVTMVMAVVLSVAVLPSSAQDDWPRDCQLPDLEEAMSAANAAQDTGDVASFVDSMSEINTLVDRALGYCVIAAADDFDLAEVNLGGAIMVGVNLLNANLAGANMSWNNLQGSNLMNANLEGADLSSAHLDEANLRRADLEGARLAEADLRGANLSSAHLEEANLHQAKFDETTVLPDGECGREQGQMVCDGYWTPDTDMTRFTDPEHPDYWNPCVEMDEPPWYCEDSDE